MKTIPNIQAVIYARVSSREQEETGYSLPEQKRFLTEYCKGKSFDLAETFSISESASGKEQRKTFNEMMEFLEKEDVSILVVETTDRLTRNFKDVPIIDKWILDDESRQIHLVKEGCVLHKNSKSHEWFMWRVKVATAEYYIRLLSENVKKGQRGKVLAGWLPTKPPVGYKTVGEKGHKIHVIDKEKASFVRKMFRLYATGNHSVKSLTKKMYEIGLRGSNGNKIVKSRIHELLKDPFYYGDFIWKGEKHKGSHKPLIDKKLFDKVQSKLSEGLTSPYYTKHSKELQGKIMCGKCGKTVTWEKQKGKMYGGCKQCKAQLDVKNKYIKQNELEEELLSRLTSIAPQNARVLKVLEKALKESHIDEIKQHRAGKEGINREIERIDKRMETLYDDRLDERIPLEKYDRKSVELKNKKEDLLNSLKNLENRKAQYYETGFAIHELALNAEKIYKSQNATIEQRRLLLSYAYDSISVLKGNIETKYTKSFEFLAEWMPKVNESLERKQKTAQTYSLSDSLPSPAVHFLLELSEAQDDSRTSKELSVEARPEDLTLTSRPLLRGQDSNLQPTP